MKTKIVVQRGLANDDWNYQFSGYTATHMVYGFLYYSKYQEYRENYWLLYIVSHNIFVTTCSWQFLFILYNSNASAQNLFLPE